MPLKALVPAFSPHNQLPSNPPITMRHPITMSLPLSQIFCGMHSPFLPPPTLHIHQPINDVTDLPFTFPMNPSKQNPESVQPLSASSTFFPSPLHPQAKCLHAIQKTIRQLQQLFKVEQLDQKTLQIIALLFQNDFHCFYLLLYWRKHFPRR